MRRFTAACSLWLVLVLAACGKTPPAEPVAEPEVTEATLRECPSDDRVWKRAIDEAERSTDPARRLRLHELALEIATAHPERWEPLWAAGECLPKDRRDDAEAVYSRSLGLAEAAGNQIGIARMANKLAGVHKERMENEAAERSYRRSIEAAERAGRLDLAGFAQNNLAGLYHRSGQFAEALEQFEAAERSLHNTASPAALRRIDYNRAVLLETMGQFSQARGLLEALRERAVQANATAELAPIDVTLGNLLMLLGEPEEASTVFQRVPESDVAQHARAGLGLGRLALRAGKADEARMHLQRASSWEEDPGFLLFVRTFQGAADLMAGDTTAARRRLVAVADQADHDRSPEFRWMARLFLGKALLRDPVDEREAMRRFREAVQAVEEQSEGLDPSSGSMTYLRERAEPFAELASALATAKGEPPAGVLGVVERAHARALRQILRGEGQAPQTVDAARLRRGLGPDELLLDFLIGEERGVVVTVTRDKITVARLPGWNELRPRVQRYRSALRRPLISREARLDPLADLRRDIDAGLGLRQLLLGPVEAQIASAGRIYVVPDQDLALLPFAALPTLDSGTSSNPGPLRFLGDDKEVAMLPMAGVVAPWSAERAPMLLAGDPLPDPAGEFAALPPAAAELAAVAEVWGGPSATRLERDALTAERVLALPLGTFNTLHFATHAVASSRDPERCAVILSRGERLGLRQIAALRLGPALVVLSACRTGEGEIIPGEGVVGLSWAFLSAGARGVVASLWSVEDASTAELMVGFHRELKAGGDPTRALALAQRGLTGSRRHPVYWAPFVIVLAPGAGS